MATASSYHPATSIDAQIALGEIIDDDYHRKKRILEICIQIKEVLEKDESIQTVMTQEFGKDILDIHKLKKEIYDNKCPIVVAGEVSAGKSSLINLLVGRSILPERQLACTTTICRIHNSEDRKIVLTDKDGIETEIPISDEDEEDKMKTVLEKHVGRGSDANRCKYVDIYLQIPMLQNHAIIVDTPGVGKNKTKQLFDYLPNAIAFIYVINAGNASGVENDDWLQEIIEHIHKQKKMGHMHYFRPETTMFVCNKWDQVRPIERDEVFQFIVGKLESCWKNFDESLQIFKLSVIQETERIEKSLSPSENYDNFVSGIQRLIPATLEAKVVRQAIRQMVFIEAMVDRVKSKISISEKSMAEKEKKRQEAEYRLKHLETKQLEKIKKNATTKVTAKCVEISKRVVKHLKSLKPESFEWKCETLPDDENDFLKIRQKARDIILERINHEINDWREKNNELVDDEINQVLKEEFKIIEEVLSKSTPFRRLLITSVSTSRVQSLKSIAESYATFGNLLPLTAVSLVMFGVYGIPTSLGLSSWALYKFWQLKNSLDMYKANKTKYMIEWTDDVLKNWISDTKVYDSMEPFLKHQISFIKEICTHMVPQILQVEKKFIEDVTNDGRSFLDIAEKYVPILCDCEILLGKLDLVFLEYFKKCEISSLYLHNIETISTIATGNSSDVHLAKFHRDNKEQQAAVKTFKASLMKSVNRLQLAEIYSLRTLKGHPNIMQLIGLSFRRHHEQKFLQIVMELCRDSLYNVVYKKRSPIPCSSIQTKTDCKDSWKFVTEIIEGICAGLDHIHKKGFVHRDLRIENVMINANVQVKLVKIGLTKQGIGDISAKVTRSEVNMAPEVFSGDLTSKEADVYSVGMIIYELWYYRPGFSQPLPNDPTEYEFIINTIDELKTLVLEKGDKNKGRPDLKAGIRPPNELQIILRQCWDAVKENRPKLFTICNMLSGVPINKTAIQTEK